MCVYLRLLMSRSAHLHLSGLEEVGLTELFGLMDFLFKFSVDNVKTERYFIFFSINISEIFKTLLIPTLYASLIGKFLFFAHLLFPSNIIDRCLIEFLFFKITLSVYLLF